MRGTDTPAETPLPPERAWLTAVRRHVLRDATRGRGERRTEACVLDTVPVASLHCLQRLHAPEHFLVMCPR
jgi:hypothetical protein